MKSKFKYYVIIWAIVVAMHNVLLFVTPNEINGVSKFDGTFWISYGFIMLAFAIQLVVAWFSLKDSDSTKLFFNIPLFTISLISLAFMIIVGTTCMILPALPSWITIISCVLALGFSIIAMMGAQAVASSATDVGTKVKTQTLFIKSLTVDVDSLISRASSEEMKKDLQDLYDVVRYSDPMSNDALQGIESQITLKIGEVTDGVMRGDAALVAKASKDAAILINDRNKRCKMLK